jgi:hypothetical protein
VQPSLAPEQQHERAGARSLAAAPPLVFPPRAGQGLFFLPTSKVGRDRVLRDQVGLHVLQHLEPLVLQLVHALGQVQARAGAAVWEGRMAEEREEAGGGGP